MGKRNGVSGGMYESFPVRSLPFASGFPDLVDFLDHPLLGLITAGSRATQEPETFDTCRSRAI